jgi:hypothetical protein
LIAALPDHQPDTDAAVDPRVLDPGDDPAFDPDFGGGSIGPGAITAPAASAGEDGPIETAPPRGGRWTTGANALAAQHRRDA